MLKRTPWPQPWLFALLILPLGIYTGFIWTPLPFLLSTAGVTVDRIAHLEALLYLPPVLMFLWAPLVDIKFRRRTWLVLGAVGTSVCVWVAFPLINPEHVQALTAVLLCGGVAVAFSMASCGGLMVAQLSTSDQSKAAAWNQAGQLGGGALAASAILWLCAHLSFVAVGFLVATGLVLPTFASLSIAEATPGPVPRFHERFSRLKAEGLAILRTPERRWSVALLIAPACTGAAQSLLPAIATSYHVSAEGVAWTNGLGGGVVLASGSMLGTLIPGHWDRRLTYVGAGLLNGLAVLVLLIEKETSVYFVGTLLYLATEGLCWARFVALVVSIIGARGADAGTWYSLLVCAGAIPQAYVTWLDGTGYRHGGVSGLLWTDGSVNFAVFAAVACVLAVRRIRLGRTRKRQS